MLISRLLRGDSLGRDDSASEVVFRLTSKEMLFQVVCPERTKHSTFNVENYFICLSVLF